jgi:HD superfamily phosphohydrolase
MGSSSGWFTAAWKTAPARHDLRAAMLAPLLHDIGQYPLAHDLKEADDQFFSHEELGAAILRDNQDLKTAVEKPQAESGWGVPVRA